MLEAGIAQIVARQGGVVSRQQLMTLGLSAGGIAGRVRTHRLFPVARGVYALSPHVDAWGRRFAAVLTAGGDPLTTGATIAAGRHDANASVSLLRPRVVTLSHWSVLHLHGLIERPPDRTHVTVEGAGGRPHAGLQVHRARTLHADDIEVLQRLPVTTPARTILDSAAGASVRQVQRLIREAEYRELLGIGAMAEVVRRNPFHPASPTVREADPQTAESQRQQTPLEDRMAEVIAGLPLEAPQSQLVIAGRSRVTYRADFAWPELRLIVETDGRAAHERTTSFQSDRERDADLAAVGWLTLRFTSLQLDDPDRVAAVLLDTARIRRSGLDANSYRPVARSRISTPAARR